ncbi:MAG: hypothetical protein H7331_01610 [Bacteroidia bacterium]|nr:hypothetical protein [Bacteroidia bacterium]
MKKNCILAIAALSISTISLAQQWGGPTTQTGTIFREGTVGIGVAAVPVSVDFMVNNATRKASKFVLGNSLLTGTYQNTESVFQLYNQNSVKSTINLLSAINATSNLSLSIDANLTGNTGIALVATSGNQKPFTISMYGTTALTITSTGQVGIGTGTSPLGTMRLAVEGTIGAREVKVTLSKPWPDYVFEDNYKLMSLQQVANYLKVERHLPYLLSAKVVETEGSQSLGETQQNMLRSLEELYLHVINLKAENEQLKQEMQVFKNILLKK